jgi:thiol:disulfide interchange protein DsbD
MLRLLLISAALSASLLTAEEKPPVVAELVCGVRVFEPGKQFPVGISIKHQPGFHTYWHSPGTVGLATIVNWELPAGFTVSELSWPVPERSTMEGYNTHGYNRDVVLLATITAPASDMPEPVEIKAKLTWMACSKKKCCNLQHATRALKLTAGKESIVDPVGAFAIAAAKKELPQPYDGIAAATFSQSRDTYVVDLTFESEALPPVKGLYFYGDGQLVNSIERQHVERTSKGYRLTLPRTDYGPENPQKLTGLLFSPDKWPGTSAKHVPVEAKRVTASEAR